MKHILTVLSSACAVFLTMVSCEKPDSGKFWGEAKIYMPQASYDPYVVPNSGSAAQTNLNYSIDWSMGVVNIYLGVYRSGLQPLEEYTVNVDVDNISIKGTTLLPAAYYDIPMSVTCPAGKRDMTFYLSVDLAWLQSNRSKDFSINVFISSPSRYELNESLCTTTIRINTEEFLKKEGL